MESLCERLDSLLLDYFDTLEQFYQCQATLEQTMKAGNLHMSRARYIRGTVSISQCQITEREMEASVRVSVPKETTTTLEEKDGTEPTFTIMASEADQEPSSDGPRRRQVDTENEDTNQADVGKQQNKTGCGKSSKDPLYWFGVLVPQALRYSQNNYKSAIERCVELANLQSRIQQIQTEYEKLLHEKNLLAMDELKIS